MRQRLLLPVGAIGGFLLALAACARTIPPSPPALPPVGQGEETGLASWYGYPHQGRRTASGEVYDMNQLTAAHRTLPLGTLLVVTNLDNGRSVEVRVNDRGPFVNGRIIDLSYAAARALGAERPGLIRVSLRVLALPGGSATPPAPAPGAPGFLVQLAAFTRSPRAETMRQALAREGEQAAVIEAVVNGGTFYRVRVGPFAERGEAEAAARRFAGLGYRPIIVQP
jgi:rare lipoprotein A